MSAPGYEPQQQSAQYRYATVQAVAAGLCDLDFGDPEGELVTGVPVHGTVPGVGDRVMVLLQGRGATVLPAPATEQFVREPPRWRGTLPSKTQASAAAESKWTGTPTVYTSDRITWSNGTITFTEGGIYSIGLVFRTGVAPTGDQRIMVTWWRDSVAYSRWGAPRSESYHGLTFTEHIPAGASCEFRVYQNTGATATFTTAYLNIAKIADL